MRVPCCEKMGLKKGPWTPEEDQILTSYIQRHGHSNWRALPKEAGLLRCGKSCRLRWVNYLRPDIKRGNFSKEEEDAIIKLHQVLGNRWSAIAAKLPGRTDNEIKNLWNTHLKKRLENTTTLTYQLLQNISASSWSIHFPTNVKFQDQDQARLSNKSPSFEENSIAQQQQHDKILPEPDPVHHSSCLLRERHISEDCQESVSLARPMVSDFATRDSIEGNNNSNLHNDINFWYNLFVNTESVNDFHDTIARIQE